MYECYACKGMVGDKLVNVPPSANVFLYRFLLIR